MKRKRFLIFIVVMACVAGTALYWLNQHGGRSAAQPLPTEMGSPPTEAVSGETSEAVEKEILQADLKRMMSEWAKEGWSVLSVSGPIPQPDGTVRCKARLRKG